MSDTSLGISLVITAVDRGTSILAQISAGLDKIGLSSTAAGEKANQAGNQLENAFKRVSDQIEKAEKQIKKVEETLTGMGTAFSALGAAILAPLGLGTKAAADFEKEMLKVKAYTNFSPDTGTAQKEFEQLTDKARELGTSTTYSASQVAQGMTELGKAGYDVDKIMGAIGPALNLAFVEGRNMGDTVEDLVGILSSYQYGIDQASRVTNVLAYTSNATTTDMAGLAESLKYCATLASQLGMNVEETTAFLGIFANNNIKGSQAGTALRRIMAELSNPLENARAALANMGVQIAKNADGSVNLIKTFEEFARVGLSTSNAFKIFGDLGANAALVATKNVEAVKKLNQENLNSAGSLDKMVETINSGLIPSWEKFKNTLLDVGIQFGGPFLASLKAVLDGISGLLRWVSDLGKQFPTLSKYVVGGAGALSLLALTFGGISLAAAGLTYAFRQIVQGLMMVLGWGSKLITAAREKVAALNTETAAIERQTVALNELAAARQRQINKQTNPKVMGEDYIPTSTGRTGSGPAPVPAPTGGGFKLSGAGIAGAAAVGGIAAALSGAEWYDVAKWEAINAAMLVVANNAGFLAGKILALIPTWAGITSAVGTFIGLLKTAGAAVAAFAAGPVGLVAGSIAAVIGAVAGGYKILSDRREAAEIQADTLKRSQEDMKRAMAEGFDPNKSLEQVDTAQLTRDPYTDLVAKRKQAAADLVGWNEKLTQAREKDAQSLFGGKSEETKTAEKNIALARQNLTIIQQEINGRIDQKKAVESVGREYEKNAESAKKEVKTNEQLAQIAKDRAEIEIKLIADSVKTKESLNALELEQAKVRINATVQSEVQAKQMIDALVVDTSRNRIALAEQEYMQTRIAREKGFEEQEKVYKQMISSGEKIAEGQKGLEELSKQRSETQIADAQKLTAAIIQELNNQEKAKDDQFNKIRNLEKQMRDEQVASRDALKGVSRAYLTEYGKIEAKTYDVTEKFRQAVQLIPSMPERALELFKQVRSESAGLIQNIESFNDRLRNAAQTGQDALRKINTFGLTGAEKYKAEVEDIQESMRRGNEAIRGGRFQEAENLYKSVISSAQGLPGSVEKTGDEALDARNLETAKSDARALIVVATNGMTDAINVQKRQAESVNEKAKANIEKAQQEIEKLINSQIQSSRDLISALNDNTNALKGKLPQAPRANQEQSQAQVVPETGNAELTSQTRATETAPSTGAQLLSSNNAPLSDLSPDLNLTPEVRQQREQAQKQVELDRGRKLNAALEKSPELVTTLSPEDFASARNARAVEDEARQQRMKDLKSLESKAAAIDRNERMGYGPSFLDASGQRYTDENLNAGVNAVTGKVMTAGDVYSAEQFMSQYFQNASGTYGPTLERAKNTPYMKDTTPNVSDQIYREQASILDEAGQRIGDTVGKAIEKANGKGMSVEIIIKNDRDATLGTVRRVI